MASKEEKALEALDVKPGDVVRTDFRGGERKGRVKEVATSTQEHPHPPKVIFERERPEQLLAHNPSTLEKVE